MRVLLFVLLLLPSVLLAEPVRVAVSVLPLKTFVEKIGGDFVTVQAMVRPGYNPHTYDPTPQQITDLSKTVLYVRTGVPFEKAWMKRLMSAGPNMQVIDVRENPEPDESHESEHHDDHGHHHHHHHESDPHVWTSPPLVIKMADVIRDKLIEISPDNQMAFEQNHENFIQELKALHTEISTLLQPIDQRKFLVFHPAWGHFAEAYDLEQTSIEHEGKHPGPRALANLIEQAKKDNIRVVFVQPQFDRRQARQVAKAINGVVIAVDPLSSDYTSNLRHVAQQFAQALKQ